MQQDTIIHSNQLAERQIHCTLESGVMVVGATHVSVVKNGTGEFTFKILEPGIRMALVQATPMSTPIVLQVSLNDNINFDVYSYDSTDGTAKDSDMILTITSFDSALES